MYQYEIMRERNKMVYLIPVLLIFGLVLIFPTPRTGIVEESYLEYENRTITKLVKNIDCHINLGNNAENSYTYNDLGDNLTICIDITSSELLHLTIENQNGLLYQSKKKIILTNVSGVGPSLLVKIYNPLDITFKSAKLSGDIQIYSTYTELVGLRKTRLVNGTIYRPWWMK